MVVRLHRVCSGAGMPLLCLHGHPGNGACMEVFTERLEGRFRMIAPDLRGYGRSRAEGRFRMEEHLTDLEQLLAEEAPTGGIWLLGWSLGGILALELVLRWPERVKGIILVATAARPWGDLRCSRKTGQGKKREEGGSQSSKLRKGESDET